MRYPVLLLDLDHTLIDSKSAEDAAFLIAASEAGIPETATHLDTYVAINQALWSAVERGELKPEEVRHQRFDQLVERLDLDVDSRAMSQRYSAELAAESRLFPGARDVLERLAAHSTLAMVTNGLSDVQRARIEQLDLAQYFDAIVISSEVGHTKPGREIFEAVFSQLGNPDPGAALMVGDSLASDIQGGADFGIDTCWYNPDARSNGGGPRATHEVSRLDQLPGLARFGMVV